jgi:RecQ family ATP-dependent DNA helicase
VSSFDRPNIHYTVVQRGNGNLQLLDFLTGHLDQAGIVYCLTRDDVEKTAQWLNRKGIKALPYHAGLVAAVRKENQDRFLLDDGIVMVATNAFGMGIDKPDVRFVAHLGLPKSIEAYYQETGRAGRDGLPADAWMCYGLNDGLVHRQRIEESKNHPQRKRVECMKLDAMLEWCRTTSCRRTLLLKYFSESGHACGNCDNCLLPPRKAGNRKIPKASGPSASQTHDVSDPLFLELRAWRSEVAHKQQVPGFAVLPDRALYHLTVHRPSTLADLSLMRGVGPVNASRYGPELLRLLA